MLPIPGTLVIGVGNKARQGKDTMAAVLRQCSADVQRFAFGDAIKAYARAFHGMTVKDGPLLQRLGHDTRQRDPEIWLRALYWQIAEARPRVAVITDMRMRNEAAMIQRMGGLLVRVNRVNEDLSPFISTDRNPNDVSEVELDDFDFDFELLNVNGHQDHFEEQVRRFYATIDRDLRRAE